MVLDEIAKEACLLHIVTGMCLEIILFICIYMKTIRRNGTLTEKKMVEGSGRNRKKEKTVHVYFKHLLQNHFPGLDETSGTSSGGAWLSCQCWGKRKDELGPCD